MDRVTSSVFRAEGTAVNWVILREGRDLTLIDAGYPGDVDAVLASVAAIGHRPEDLRAVLVTHAHVDHVGALNHLHERYGTPVLMHPDELANATGERHESATPADVARRAWRPSVLRWSLAITRAGGTQHPVVTHARGFEPGVPLDLPGRPVPVHLPGHTSGSAAFVLPEAGIVVTGDALVTGHPLLRGTGPQLLPDFFHHDTAAARHALETLGRVDADVVVPGHGAPWRGDLRAATARLVA
ncbi:MBL fold metallo-hydrolase [Aeromicrobium sp. Leaf350]|uniref:MBL fold metallo-hydrolase n=1 Tax=Aeromicrobium sp. Leaf350 TaxID=2876565 RepID=UPI001E2A8AA3|nr:MBL fold metallo-hydrolase [Aeromicrobium sp. Leaf350]